MPGYGAQNCTEIGNELELNEEKKKNSARKGERERGARNKLGVPLLVLDLC